MLSVKDIADNINGEIIGDSNFVIKGICDLEIGKENYLTYIKDPSYEKYLSNTKATVIIVDKDCSSLDKNKIFINII